MTQALIAALATSIAINVLLWIAWRTEIRHWRTLRGFRHATTNALRTGIPSDGRG